MKKDTIEPIFSYQDWVKRLADNEFEEGENSLLNQVVQWKSTRVKDKKGHEQTQYFLILNLHPLE